MSEKRVKNNGVKKRQNKKRDSFESKIKDNTNGRSRGEKTEKNSSKLGKRIALVILVVSLLVLGIYFSRGLWLKYKSQFDGKLTVEQVEKNKKKPFKTGEIKTVTDKDILKASMINWNMDGVIGAIYIPVINTQAMITYGYDNTSMFTSVGTMHPDQVMGGVNNYAIAGHNMASKGVLFTDVQEDNMHKGDKIYLTDVSNVYEYEMSALYVVEDARGDLALSSPYPNRRMVTLVTCTPDGKKRVVVQGDLTNQWKTENSPSDVKKAFKL